MKSNKTGRVGIFITIVVLVVLVILSNVKNSQSSFVNSGISKMFLSVQNGFTHVGNKIKGKKEVNSNIDQLQEENQKLKEEKASLEEKLREYDVIKSQNQKLVDYLNLKNKYQQYTTVPGEIIEKSYSNYENVIVINIGKNDGIEVNMPVISTQGLVGHISEVNDTTSKVQLIIDAGSTVSASIVTSNENVLIKGNIDTENKLKATSIPVQTTILSGDQIITSGFGGIYPKGILIGSVKTVVNTKNDIDRYANIEPATNFNTLESVLVIKQY